MKWPRPRYADRTVYNKAGKALLSQTTTDEQFAEAAEALGNWRASHHYPLHAITMSLRGRAKAVDKNAIVVQRSKRLLSILPKLGWMRLTQIQDIGGCRAVVQDLTRLNRLHAIYEKSRAKKDTRRPFVEGDPDNYINSPKKDGYRGIHYVFRYRSDLAKHECYNDLKIEVQLRTKLQHTWATALEIVDLFTGQRLKTDIDLKQADPRWKRFFALAATVIAKRENCPPVPNTPTEYPQLARELKEVSDELGAIAKLEAYGKTVKHLTDAESKRRSAYIITLNTQTRLLNIRGYGGRSLATLDDEYLKTEREHLDQPHIQVVQVYLDSIDQLKRAYPNYDLDTTSFVQIIKDAIARG